MKSRGDAIISAATNGELNRLKELVAEYDDGRGLAKTVMSFSNDEGLGAIHCAALEGKLDVLKYLIEELGIDVDVKDENGDSPLLHAMVDGNMDTVEYLLGKGADPKTSDATGHTPLHCAAEEGHIEMLTRLLSGGVNINALSENGTPLEVAASHGKLEVVQILLDHNANPNLYSSRFFTPLTAAILSGLPQSLRCVEILLEAGADPNGGSHATPLVAAATEGFTEIVKLLIQAGADPDVTNSFGLTPLEIAALNGYEAEAEILFPVTSRIPEYIDWSFDGVISHVHSDQANEQRKLKAMAKFHEAKLSGADAFEKQDYLKALVSYSQANAIYPHDANILSDRSMCWARLEEGEEALEDANACIMLRPDWPTAHYRAGVAYNLLTRYEEAREAFLRGLALSPDSQELKDALREAESQLNSDGARDSC